MKSGLLPSGLMNELRIAVRSFADFEGALAAQLGAYRASNPETAIEMGRFDLQGLEEVVLGGHGLRDGGWDLAIFPTDWIGAAVGLETLECLTAWMRDIPLPEWPEGWPASLLEPLRRGGDFHCIPWHDGPECLIYRKDLFEDAGERKAFAEQYGRELAAPATWQEFHETARFFTRSPQGLFGTAFAAYPDGHNTLYDLVLQVWSRGGELYSGDGAPTLAGPVVVEALDFYRRILKDRSACYPDCERLDSVRSGDVFLSGRIALMANWFGFATRCNRRDSPLRDKIGLAPIPGGRAGQSATLSNYWVLAIVSGSRQKPAAYDLLRHVAGAGMDKLTALHGAVGVRLSTWNDAEVRELVPLYRELEGLSAQARTLPFCEDLPRLATIINRVTIEALGTDEASEAILARAQATALRQGLRLS